MAEIKIVLIPKGENIIEVLSAECDKQGINWGNFEEAVGEIKDYELIVHHPNGRVENMHSKNAAMIQTVSGEVKKQRNGMEINLKTKISPGGLNSFTGKLMSATAATDVEIAIRKINQSKIIIG